MSKNKHKKQIIVDPVAVKQPVDQVAVKQPVDQANQVDQIDLLQEFIAQEEDLKAALKAAKEKTRALANTVLTSERYQQILESHEAKIKAATTALDAVSKPYFIARDQLDTANVNKINFCKLYGRRGTGTGTGKGQSGNGNGLWEQLITVKDKFLTISLQYQGISDRFEGTLPLDPEDSKMLGISSWLAFRTKMVGHFKDRDPKLDADQNLLLRAKLSSVKRALESREYIIV